MNILITGGTGAFGKAFIKRLLGDDTYHRICVYSRDEAKQASMRITLGDNERIRWFIGDIRDKDRLFQALRGVDVVIHAAALKRIEVGAYNPEEMIKTNIYGAMNLVQTANAAGVKKVVALSTDKAWNPISPYGHSKALAESLFLSSNDTYGLYGTKFAVTRYGNVAGSTGSVIPVWRRILRDTDTVPITDPECTRFWMFMHEAVDLVLNTIQGMPSIPVTPRLPAFRLGDLAEAMGAKKFTVKGLGYYEKLHEGMIDGNTSDKARRMSVDEIREALKFV